MASESQRAEMFGFTIVSDRSIPAGVVAIVQTARAYVSPSAVQFFRFRGVNKIVELTDQEVGALLREHIGDRFERERKRAQRDA